MHVVLREVTHITSQFCRTIDIGTPISGPLVIGVRT